MSGPTLQITVFVQIFHKVRTHEDYDVWQNRWRWETDNPARLIEIWKLTCNPDMLELGHQLTVEAAKSLPGQESASLLGEHVVHPVPGHIHLILWSNTHILVVHPNKIRYIHIPDAPGTVRWWNRVKQVTYLDDHMNYFFWEILSDVLTLSGLQSSNSCSCHPSWGACAWTWSRHSQSFCSPPGIRSWYMNPNFLGWLYIVWNEEVVPARDVLHDVPLDLLVLEHRHPVVDQDGRLGRLEVGPGH